MTSKEHNVQLDLLATFSPHWDTVWTCLEAARQPNPKNGAAQVRTDDETIFEQFALDIASRFSRKRFVDTREAEVWLFRELRKFGRREKQISSRRLEQVLIELVGSRYHELNLPARQSTDQLTIRPAPQSIKQRLVSELSNLAARQGVTAPVELGRQKARKNLIRNTLIYGVLVSVIAVPAILFLWFGSRFLPEKIEQQVVLERKWGAVWTVANPDTKPRGVYVHPYLLWLGPKMKGQVRYEQGKLAVENLSGSVYILNANEKTPPPFDKVFNDFMANHPQAGKASVDYFSVADQEVEIELIPAGTAFYLQRRPDTFKLGVLRGAVTVKMTGKLQTVEAGQSINLRGDSAGKFIAQSPPTLEAFQKGEVEFSQAANKGQPQDKPKAKTKQPKQKLTKVELVTGEVFVGKLMQKTATALIIQSNGQKITVPLEQVASQETIYK